MAKTATVVHIEEGFSNSALRIPYALARLSCGHLTSVQLRDTRGVCCGCGAVLTHAQGASFERCACGKWMVKNIDSPNPHCADDRVTKIGDSVECETCARNVERIAWLRALPKGIVHHARFDPRFSQYHLYRHDVTSPSGFFLIGSVPATAEFDAVLNEIRVSPLSPTERA